MSAQTPTLPAPVRRSDLRRICIRVTDDQFDDLCKLSAQRGEAVQLTVETIVQVYLSQNRNGEHRD